MIYLHDAIRLINPVIVTTLGDVAYDQEGKEVAYDVAAAEVKLAELQAQETAQVEAQATAKAQALAKLTALGLTEEEVKALIS